MNEAMQLAILLVLIGQAVVFGAKAVAIIVRTAGWILDIHRWMSGKRNKRKRR